MGGPSQRPTVVTLAAPYAGGAVVGPRVARPGVRFLGRDRPQSVAARAGLPPQVVIGVDEDRKGGRFANSLGRRSMLTSETGGSFERLDVQRRVLRTHGEEYVAGCRSTGGVVLGRGGSVDESDPSLYHLVHDSTELDLGPCSELIVAATTGRAQHFGEERITG